MTTVTSASVLYILSLQSETSKVAMKSTLNLIAKKLQGVSSHTEADWSKLNYESVLTLMNTLKAEGLSPARVNTYLAAVKGVAKYSWMNKSIDVEVYTWIQQVKRLKGTRETKGRSLVKGELSKVISHCVDKGSVLGVRDAALFATMYSAGLRRQEVVNLNVEDINLVTNEILIKGKNNKHRTTVINDNSMKLIKNYMKVRGNITAGTLFSRCRKGGKFTGESISTQAVYNIVCGTATELGLPKMSCHDYRRSFCTDLLENGTDLFTVSKLMGHADINTTRTYDKRGSGVKDAASAGLTF